MDAGNALRQVLKDRCPDDMIFRDEDIKRLVDEGFTTPAALARATKDDLLAVLPGRRGVVAGLWETFGLRGEVFSPSKRPRFEGVEGGMLERGTLMDCNHPLSKFVACLQDLTLQNRINTATPNSVIKLPEGIFWLGDQQNFSNELFMRPCYLHLLEAKEEYFKLKKYLTAVVYTGTPGIGKSHLCAFVVAQKLIAGTVVYYESSGLSKKEGFFKLQLKGGVGSVLYFKSSHVLITASSNENAAYIVDGGLPGCSSVAAMETQIFASPSRELFRPERKARGYLYLHTPLFDLEELYSLISVISEFKILRKENVEAWFLAAGGVARTVLLKASRGLDLEAWKSTARVQISSMDKAPYEPLILGLQAGTFAPEIDSLFHWRVDETYLRKKDDSPEKPCLRRFKTKVLCFASDWVANQVFLHLRLEKVLHIASLIINSTNEVDLAALRGHWFEHLSHMFLSAGGTFQCRWLDTNVKFTLTLPKASLYTYTSIKDASEKCRDDFSVYCMPMARNQKTIDSLNSPYLLFQMAYGPKHDINLDGLTEITRAMGEGGRSIAEAKDMVKRACDPPASTFPVLVFCTTPSNFESSYTKPQKFVKGGKVISEVRDIQLQQAVLRMPIVYSESPGGFVKLALE